MLISLAWLSRHVDLDSVDVSDLANRFTLSVAELEGVIHLEDVQGAVVGRVESAEPIAGTKLRQCRVNIGGEARQIVCGAPNAAAGQHVVAVLPGGRLGDAEVVAREVSGVLSEGVLCSEQELGIGSENAGILVLNEAVAPGTPLGQLAPVKDVLFEVDNKSLTHRPDLWGHRGIAREVAALLGRALKPLAIDAALGSEPPCAISIEAPDACPRYSAVAVRGVRVAPSPLWLRVLLHRVGTRAINNVVDATNFVMLDLGNPVHAFDRRLLREDRVIVRFAKPGEELRTLDGVSRQLGPTDLVIADPGGAIGLAGILGGEHSGVEATTTEVLLEAANFDPAVIRLTGQRLGLRTEASARFEKSLDPRLTEAAALGFVRLLQELSPGATASSALVSFGKPLPAAKRIALRLDLVRRRLGTDIGDDVIAGYLGALEFDVRRSADGVLDVGVPSFRATKDISEEVDLVEEVGRCYGYNNIPPRPPSVTLRAPDPNLRKQFEATARSYLTQAAGLDEILTYSFASEPLLEKFGSSAPLRATLRNPISAEMRALRTELSTALLGALNRNAQSYDSVGLFEIGRVFLRSGEKGSVPNQPVRLGALIAEAGQSDDPEAKLFFRLKGVLLGLAAALGRPRITLEQGSVTLPWVHPSRHARIVAEAGVLGYLAEIHPLAASKLERPFRVALLELDLEALRGMPAERMRAGAPPQFPAVHRDFAFVVEEAVPAEKLRRVIEQADPLVETVAFGSLYRGAGVPSGAKCLAWSVTLRDPERTLTEAEVERAARAILDNVGAKTGGRLR